MYKALITDLDNTVVKVLSDGSEIGEATKSAIKLAQRQGFKIACATGRGWPSTKPVVNRLGISDLCIIEGGSCIIDPQQEKIIWEKFLDGSVSLQVMEIFKRMSAGKELVKSSSNTARVPIAEVKNISGKNRIIYLLGTDAKTAETIVNAVNAMGTAAAHKTTPSWRGEGLFDVHVTHLEGTKENAIKVWQKLEGVTIEETIGLGDSENDLPIFQSSGLKIAVGNATDTVKQLADYISPAQTDGALKHVIEKFLVA